MTMYALQAGEVYPRQHRQRRLPQWQLGRRMRPMWVLMRTNHKGEHTVRCAVYEHLWRVQWPTHPNAAAAARYYRNGYVPATPCDDT